MNPGIYLDVPESKYHADDFGDELRLSVSIAQSLILESESHAFLRHPKLGGQPFTPTTEMDRGTVIHELLLGTGRGIRVVECDDWKKKKSQEERDAARDIGLVPLTRPQYEAAKEAAGVLREKLRARGFPLAGKSEVTLLWEEQASNGATVYCRGRLDHLEANGEFYDLKVTGDANPKTITRGHLTRMGYDIQGHAYTRGLERACPEFQGRAKFALLFCEPVAPYCITEIRFGGSLRELGERRWRRAVDRWERCLRTGEWRDYTNEPVYAEATNWELDAEEAESAA